MRYLKEFENMLPPIDPTEMLVYYMTDIAKKNSDKNYIDADLKLVETLLKKGANPNAHDENNNYGALINMSAYTTQLELMELLIKYGANVNEQNSIESTSLYVATHRNKIYFVKCLVENGADVDIPNNGGWTPIQLAVYFKFWEIAIFLLQKGANIKAIFKNQIENNYEFQKELIKKYPTEFINNIGKIIVNKKIIEEFDYIFRANKYNL